MSRASILKTRAEMLARSRAFFAKRGVLEVDPGALVKCPPNDSNIDCIATDQDGGYLHTSPEYAMKRLLSEGLPDIYFLGHVYRKNELGSRHNPEFTMLEWYRKGISFSDMIDETAEFLSLFLGPLPLEIISYREAFQKYVGINYTSISLAELQKMTNNHWERESCLHFLISHEIEPHLGIDKLTAITDFPPSEAALACTIDKQGEIVAERYEIYHKGIELCNGYHELSDADELRCRFHEKNKHRLSEGKAAYPLDEKLLEAVSRLPDCCGVALGFDRALMLHCQQSSIKNVIPFSWEEC